jgi:hypothetical protein
VRLGKAVGLGLALALAATPLLAANKPHRGECKQLTRQIGRYERDAKWAEQRGNELWEEASEARAKQLTERRDALCPDLKKKNPLAKAADLIAAAAKAAAPYVIPGL